MSAAPAAGHGDIFAAAAHITQLLYVVMIYFIRILKHLTKHVVLAGTLTVTVSKVHYHFITFVFIALIIFLILFIILSLSLHLVHHCERPMAVFRQL